jgi:hypothetical protein
MTRDSELKKSIHVCDIHIQVLVPVTLKIATLCNYHNSGHYPSSCLSFKHDFLETEFSLHL